MGEMRNACNILVGKPEEKRPIERPRRDARMILKWIWGKYEWRVWSFPPSGGFPYSILFPSAFF
jgi:hypothetical protein